MTNAKQKEEAYRLRTEENMTYGEISRLLDIPCSTIKSWFSRAGMTWKDDHVSQYARDLFASKTHAVSRPFTEDEQRLLFENPYVRSVCESQIRFTQAFRDEYWQRYKNGQESKDILLAMGIDPNLLGETRRIGLHKRIAEAAANGFLTADEEDDPSALFENGVVPAKALAQMRHELAYLRQEVEFIKKILSTDEETKL